MSPIKKLLLLAMLLSLSACGVKTSDLGIKSLDFKGKAQGAETAPSFTITSVPVPAKFSSILVSGQKFVDSTAIQLPSGKILAMGTALIGKLHVARFNGEDLDPSFGHGGWMDHDFVTRLSFYSSHPYVVGSKIMVAAFAWNSDEWSGGLANFIFDQDGNLDTKLFRYGMAYKQLIKGPSCTSFKINDVIVQGSQSIVSAEYYDQNSGSKKTAVANFTVIKPTLTSSPKPVPATCDHLNYSGHAYNSVVTKITQSDCGQYSFERKTLWMPGREGSTEKFDIKADGSCMTSKFFGESCFYLENGTLVRETITSAWDIEKTYFSLVIPGSQICGIYWSGPAEKWLIMSKYPPSDSRHQSVCEIY